MQCNCADCQLGGLISKSHKVETQSPVMLIAYAIMSHNFGDPSPPKGYVNHKGKRYPFDLNGPVFSEN